MFWVLESDRNGLNLPGFIPFTYNVTIIRPHGTGARRLEDQAALEEAEKKWDPENHPSNLAKSRLEEL